ncbi:hypothetical protein CU098_005803 [Rhizopus stolonifer]|uniref:Uncharacterized protein n=1 Tax=Rhizopus stolonifer TaxID=4846 RepID=A0A367JED6_RHIST|nr:hypothetical protein CU098_005803 [Rhizopus stolonifer]
MGSICNYLDSPGDLETMALRNEFADLGDQIHYVANQFDQLKDLFLCCLGRLDIQSPDYQIRLRQQQSIPTPRRYEETSHLTDEKPVYLQRCPAQSFCKSKTQPYAVRSLAGMINDVGLLPQARLSKVNQVYKFCRRPGKRQRFNGIDSVKFQEDNDCHLLL